MMQIPRAAIKLHIPTSEGAPVSHSINLQYTYNIQSAIMRRRVMLKEIISVVKLSVFPIWCWPLSKNATRFKTFCMKLYHCWCISMAICLAAPLLYGISHHFNEPALLAQLLVLSSACFHMLSNFISYQLNYHHIQNVTYEMVNFCDVMKPHEEVVIQRYIDKCVVFYGVSMFTFYFVTAAIIVILPFFTHQPFPTLAEYPFDVSYQPLKTIIFIQQSLAGIIMSAQLCTNILMTLLLWFATARFEILCEELKKATDFYPLFQCIKKHQELLKYATEVAICARPFVFSTICCSTCVEVLIFLVFISHQPTSLLVHFFGLGFAALVEVFMFAWPGEYLMSMCKVVAKAAYDSFKCDQSIQITKCLQIIIMRSQKPIIVSIPCFMPALSFNYFATYVSTILSYFTTLRVMIEDDYN